MRTTMKLFGIFVLAIGMLWLWNDGFFVRLMPDYIKQNKLSEKYGGVYVFYPEFREEIKKRERERDELAEKLKDEITSDPRQIRDSDGTMKTIYAWDFTRIDKALPQILSNGCKYIFGSYDDSHFDSYYEKIKEFVGEEVYEKDIKSALRITSSYRCEGKKSVIVTIETQFGTVWNKYGLFGDEGAGFSLTATEGVSMGGPNTFELRNGKFEKVEKEYEGWR